MAQIETKPTQATVSAVITRADGSVEDLGVISYWHRSFFRRLLWRVKRFIGG